MLHRLSSAPVRSCFPPGPDLLRHGGGGLEGVLQPGAGNLALHRAGSPARPRWDHRPGWRPTDLGIFWSWKIFGQFIDQEIREAMIKVHVIPATVNWFWWPGIWRNCNAVLQSRYLFCGSPSVYVQGWQLIVVLSQVIIWALILSTAWNFAWTGLLLIWDTKLPKPMIFLRILNYTYPLVI